MYLNNSVGSDITGVARLTLTWDVFKFANLVSIIRQIKRLTLTWDVFKWS